MKTLLTLNLNCFFPEPIFLIYFVKLLFVFPSRI